MGAHRGWFQEGGFKGQHSLAIGTGALWEQNHHGSIVQDRLHVFGQLSNLGPSFAVCEQRYRPDELNQPKSANVSRRAWRQNTDGVKAPNVRISRYPKWFETRRPA